MAKISLEHLDAEHLQPFRQALSNALSTPVAESTYAQIIDGMPLSAVYEHNHWYLKNFPVESHDVLCAGSLEKAISFRSNFDFSLLQFEAKASLARPSAHLHTHVQTPDSNVKSRGLLSDLPIDRSSISEHCTWIGGLEASATRTPCSRDSRYCHHALELGRWCS